MSLSETTLVDKIEVTEFGVVQVREATRISRDGEVIAQNFHRFTVAPGEDTSGMDAKVVAVCSVIHTPEVIATYQAMQANSRSAQQTPQE